MEIYATLNFRGLERLTNIFESFNVVGITGNQLMTAASPAKLHACQIQS